MKKLYIIGGAMGVGKSTVCRLLVKRLKNSVFLDGDWCWNPESPRVTPQMKKMVVDNICFLLKNYIKCPEYENIVFCWVLHRQDIIDEIVNRIKQSGCEIICASLVCSEKELTARLKKDIESSVRQADIIGRAAARLNQYKRLATIKIETGGKTPGEIANEIAGL